MEDKKKNALHIFNHRKFGKIRTIVIDGDVWFVAKDVAQALGYSNPQKAIRDHVTEDDKTVNDSFIVNGTKGVLINESGLYGLIMSSRLPSAMDFQHWITSEVVPSIRQRGLYAVDDLHMVKEVLNNPRAMIQILEALDNERQHNEMLTEENAVQKRQLIEMQPKADYYESVLSSRGLFPITVIAKEYGMSGKRMNELLHELHIQYNVNGTWVLYQEFAGMGLTGLVTQPITSRYGHTFYKNMTFWTQKGRLFIYNRLKENGILPIKERDEMNVLSVRNGEY